MLEELDRRDVERGRKRDRARIAMILDMLKSYAAPLILAAFINPILKGGPLRLEVVNYALLLGGLVMIGLTIIFAPEKD